MYLFTCIHKSLFMKCLEVIYQCPQTSVCNYSKVLKTLLQVFFFLENSKKSLYFLKCLGISNHYQIVMVSVHEICNKFKNI